MLSESVVNSVVVVWCKKSVCKCLFIRSFCMFSLHIFCAHCVAVESWVLVLYHWVLIHIACHYSLKRTLDHLPLPGGCLPMMKLNIISCVLLWYLLDNQVVFHLDFVGVKKLKNANLSNFILLLTTVSTGSSTARNAVSILLLTPGLTSEFVHYEA